jgi:hypothetical protein
VLVERTARRAAWSPLLVACLLACKPVVPAHLAREPSPAEGEAAAPPAQRPTTREEAVRLVVAGDPLARRTNLPDPGILSDVREVDALREVLIELRAMESGQADATTRLQLLATRYRTGEPVAVLRGYRLQLADRLLGIHSGDPDHEALAALTPLLTRLRPDEDSTVVGRHPFAVLAGELSFPEAVRQHGDRWTLLGWLSAPDVPLRPVAEALQAAPYDALRASKLGRLVLARAAGASAPHAQALADLRRATSLSLQRAAADRDKEQAAYADARKAAGDELGTTNPAPLLLDRALEGFIDAAGEEEAVAGALIAYTGLRWLRACDWDPCAGVDRVEVLATVEDWSPKLDDLALTWKVIALKDALDGMDVGHDTVAFSNALVDLIDALVGTGASPVVSSMLARRTADPAVWKALGEAIGVEATTWEDARGALGQHLRAEAERASKLTTGAEAELLTRIARRAVP